MFGGLEGWHGKTLRRCEARVLIMKQSRSILCCRGYMKIILGQVILNYDCQFADPKAPRLWTWRSTILPRASAKVIFTPVGEKIGWVENRVVRMVLRCIEVCLLSPIIPVSSHVKNLVL